MNRVQIVVLFIPFPDLNMELSGSINHQSGDFEYVIDWFAHHSFITGFLI